MKRDPPNPATDCFYALPDKTPTAHLKEYEAYIRAQYGNYSHRIRNRFFFAFSCAVDRDRFLDSLEQTARKTLVVERVVLHDY